MVVFSLYTLSTRDVSFSRPIQSFRKFCIVYLKFISGFKNNRTNGQNMRMFSLSSALRLLVLVIGSLGGMEQSLLYPSVQI